MSEWQRPHEQEIDSFLAYMNEATDSFVLKGGTALYKCYGLDRFSEDIDFDSADANLRLGDFLPGYCGQRAYAYRVAKDTATTERYLVRYGAESRPLKIEASYRRSQIDEHERHKIGGISVYTIEALCILKALAYSGRDKIRDVYDLSFICANYHAQLSPQAIAVVRSAVAQKGFEHFDYVLASQKDELIDEARFTSNFLDMYDRLGLLKESDYERHLETVEGYKSAIEGKRNGLARQHGLEEKFSPCTRG
ncbi:MAG: nucleotidyl transferase AbiEii/AbiGii toxin family protein [Clostridiales bacterium]|nr:nucleotidyl transferase AbiEii/AbiGii toxin family protein [Clostridiales bacterium]